MNTQHHVGPMSVLSKALELCAFDAYDPDIAWEQVDETSGNLIFSIVDVESEQRLMVTLPAATFLFAKSADNLGKVVANAWLRQRDAL